MVMSRSIIWPSRPGEDMVQVPETSTAQAARVRLATRASAVSAAFFRSPPPDREQVPAPSRCRRPEQKKMGARAVKPAPPKSIVFGLENIEFQSLASC
jgi:hypothetical protein